MFTIKYVGRHFAQPNNKWQHLVGLCHVTDMIQIIITYKSRYCSLNPFISGLALCSEHAMSAFPLQRSSSPYHPWTCREPDISGGGNTDSGSCWPCRWRSFCYGDTDSWLGRTGSDEKSPGEEAVCHQSITELSKHDWHVLHQHCITKPSIFRWHMWGAEPGSVFFLPAFEN